MGAQKQVREFPSPVFRGSNKGTSPLLTLTTILTVDVLGLCLVYWLATVCVSQLRPDAAVAAYLPQPPVVALILVAFLTVGQYPGLMLHPAEEIRRVSSSVMVVFLVIACLAPIRSLGNTLSGCVFLLSGALAAPVMLGSRYLTRKICSALPWWGHSAVVLATSPAAQRIVRSLNKSSDGLRIVGVFTDDEVAVWPHDLPPILGRFPDAAQLASVHGADYAIVASSRKSDDVLRYIIQDCCKGYRHILLLSDLSGLSSTGVRAREIGAECGFEVPQCLFQPGARFAKRLLDIVLSSVILLVLSPAYLLICLLIKMTSPGPAFFGHSRYGQHGKLFKAWKFRTMLPQADQVLAEFLLAHPEHQLEWKRFHKLKNDPRITIVGKWLRRYSLDELPQLWNVLKGEMSMVGPRPIVKLEIEKYGGGYDLYTRVLPGLTGLWQVSGRNNTTYDERVAFDEYYVRNWSVWLDTDILARTVKVVLTAEGAY